MSSLRRLLPAPVRVGLILIGFFAIATLAACSRGNDAGEGGGFSFVDPSDCLPPITLLDQHGNHVSLADLKGKPALFDFIYTSCPGECLLLTQHMRRIAAALGPELGQKVRLVSITVDPEHDQPEQLLRYADNQDADLKGWLFLTGSAAQIDEVMQRFKLIRQHQADGTVDHVSEMFLVAPDGRAVLQYLGDKISIDHVVADLNAAAAGKAVTTGEDTVRPVKF